MANFTTKFYSKIKIRKNRFLNNWALNKRNTTDKIARISIFIISVLALLIMISLIGFVIYKSVYYFKTDGFFGFFKPNWKANQGVYGIGKILVASSFVLLIALIIAVPLTIFSALFINEYLSNWWKRKVTAVIQLLAGIPSVVFGLFSLSVLGDLFMKWGAPSSSNLIITCITLAFMGLPIMVSLSLNAIEDVPLSNRYNSLALGISKPMTVMKIVLKTAKIRIIGAILLGVARIIGETMAVLMICGNDPNGLHLHSGFLKFLYSSVATLASTIGLEILESTGGVHESALYAIGVMLFALITIINIAVLTMQSISSRKRHRKFNYISVEKRVQKHSSDLEIHNLIFSKIEKRRSWNKIRDGVVVTLMVTATVLAVGFTLIIIGTIIYRGLDGLEGKDLISTSTYNGQAGILSTFLVSMLLVVCTITISLPIALIVAIFINEYVKTTSFTGKSISFSLNILASTPSIVYGLFGLILFITILGVPLSVFAAGLTLSLVILPMLIRNITDALEAIPTSMRSASYSLGVNKIRTIRKVILPNATSAIATSVILAIARVIGETAPVYLTLGTSVQSPTNGFLSPGATMTTEILTLWKSGTSPDVFRVMYEIALTIMVLVLLMNWLANYMRVRLNPMHQKSTWRDRKNYWKLTIKSWNIKSLIGN